MREPSLIWVYTGCKGFRKGNLRASTVRFVIRGEAGVNRKQKLLVAYGTQSVMQEQNLAN